MGSPVSNRAGVSWLQAGRGQVGGQAGGQPSLSCGSQAGCLLLWPHPGIQSLPSRAPFPPTGSGNRQIRAKSRLGRAARAGTWVKPLGSWPGKCRGSLGSARVARDRPPARNTGGWRGLCWLNVLSWLHRAQQPLPASCSGHSGMSLLVTRGRGAALALRSCWEGTASTVELPSKDQLLSGLCQHLTPHQVHGGSNLYLLVQFLWALCTATQCWRQGGG